MNTTGKISKMKPVSRRNPRITIATRCYIEYIQKMKRDPEYIELKKRFKNDDISARDFIKLRKNVFDRLIHEG